MKQRKRGLKLPVFILFVILGLDVNLTSVYAQDNSNTITFDNQSGEPAIVKLAGPTGQTITVPNGQSRTANVAAGEYYILVRYGSKPEAYRYAKGDPFTVTQTATQYSAISITLHKAVVGNQPIHPTSREEFEKTPVDVYVQLDENGNIVERKILEGKAQLYGSVVVVEGGTLVGKLVVPEGEKIGLVLVEDPLPEKNPTRENRYRRGSRYILLKDVGKKDVKYYRAIWLELGDHLWLVLPLVSRDAPGTIYRKGSIIDGKLITQDMRLTSEGNMESVADTPNPGVE